MINTARHGIKELESSELSSLENLNTNADLLDKAIDHWGTATWNESILNVTSEIPSQELYTGLSVSFMLTATNPESATIKLDSLDEKSLLNSTGSSIAADFLTAGQIYTITYDGTAFRINNVAHATSADSATSATNADTVDGMHASAFATATQGAEADAALPASDYTAADILTKIKTVDGTGSGLDADTLDGLDSTAFATADSLSVHLSDSKCLTAGGTATAITISTATLTDGYLKNFVASANNSGAATTINGLPLYKPNTATAPTLIAGKAYTVWYNAASNCFFVKASAEGTATAADVLAGKTFSNDDSTGLVGTITSKAAATYTPRIANQIIAAGQYLNGSQTILGDANLIPANILSGKSIFGVAGSVIDGTGMKHCANGTVVSSSDYLLFNWVPSGSGTWYYITVTGLTFKPRLIIAVPTVGGCLRGPTIYFADGLYFENGDTGYIEQNGGILSATSPASVTSTGFTLPAAGNSPSTLYNWTAYE
jgi:hypothetical protein